ncbi:MAG TPA: hypothetical protein VFZ27_14845 [Terriglobia bacterium]|nr:hypothetical protein [Terriglobia bacterium]
MEILWHRARHGLLISSSSKAEKHQNGDGQELAVGKLEVSFQNVSTIARNPMP